MKEPGPAMDLGFLLKANVTGSHHRGCEQPLLATRS